MPQRPRSEGVLGELHDVQRRRLGDLALGGQPGQDRGREEARGRDLALVEGLVARPVARVEPGQRDLGLPAQQPGDDQVAEGQQQPGGVEPGPVDLVRLLEQAARKPCMPAAIASTSSAARASAARSAFSRPLPPSPAANSRIWAVSWPSAAPPFRTILRKYRSRPWMAVVPSYRLSILASRRYCSIG